MGACAAVAKSSMGSIAAKDDRKRGLDLSALSAGTTNPVSVRNDFEPGLEYRRRHRDVRGAGGTATVERAHASLKQRLHVDVLDEEEIASLRMGSPPR
jgi:hypothetical protein